MEERRCAKPISYLLQTLREQSDASVLLTSLPPARTTRDLDVMLAAELVASPADFQRLREQIEATGFASQERNQYWQWSMGEGTDAVVLDILVERIPECYRTKGSAPRGMEGAIHVDERRARPKGRSFQLHARRTEEAIAAFRDPWRVAWGGRIEATHRLAQECSAEPPLLEARRIVQEHFSSAEGIGVLRLREHPDVDGITLEVEVLLEVLPELLGERSG